jgi:coproporphyrinogen III oxidase-like Fe-S oxidoreductase
MSKLENDGLFEISEKGFHATEAGHLFLRNVAMNFDAHLEKAQSQAKNPVFSRTV